MFRSLGLKEVKKNERQRERERERERERGETSAKLFSTPLTFSSSPFCQNKHLTNSASFSNKKHEQWGRLRQSLFSTTDRVGRKKIEHFPPLFLILRLFFINKLFSKLVRCLARALAQLERSGVLILLNVQIY